MKTTPILISGIFLATALTTHAANEQEITLADPTIFTDANGLFYLYGTAANSDNGFPVYTSPDLETWALHPTPALAKGDAFGKKWFWAPQVIFYHDKYYMIYTAEEHIAYAIADNPQGPFTGGGKIEADVRTIDPFVFFDTDGTPYLYHVRLDNGNRIFVVQLTADLSASVPGTLTECIHATLPWEDTANADWTVTEGPTVIARDGRYYLFYSANDFRNPDYAVGVAESSSPLGPWEKQSAPIISRGIIGENGTGHGDIFFTTDGKPHYVFHTHNSDEQVAPRTTAIIELDSISFKPVSGTYKKLHTK